VVCNASPDIHQQIAANPALQPHQGLRDSGIGAIILVDGQIDHCTGLLLLREHRAPLELWTTEDGARGSEHRLPILQCAEAFLRRSLASHPVDGAQFEIPALPGVTVSALPVEGKPGPYSAYRENPRIGDNIGLIFRGLGQRPPVVLFAGTRGHPAGGGAGSERQRLRAGGRYLLE